MTSVVLTEVQERAPADWNRFVAAHARASVYHRVQWLELVREVFKLQIFFIVAREGEEIVGILPLVRQRSRVFGDFLTSIPFFNYGGPLFRDQDAHAALLERASELARTLKVNHVELRTQIPVAQDWERREDKVTLLRELPSTVSELSKQLGSKLRSQIKRAERERPVVRKGSLELLDAFYCVFSRNMRDLGTPVYSKEFFRQMLERMPESCHLVTVELNGQPAAAGFLITANGATEIPWAACTAEAKPLGGNMRLYWEVLSEAIERGSRTFDFGRSSVDAGTYKFKLQWGARPVPLYWHYWLPPGQRLPQLHHGNSKMQLAIALWKKMPLWICEAVGPHIVRNLP